MKVNISPAVALKEAEAEIGWLRNRNLILAQAVADLQRKLVARPASDVLVVPQPAAEAGDENPD